MKRKLVFLATVFMIALLLSGCAGYSGYYGYPYDYNYPYYPYGDRDDFYHHRHHERDGVHHDWDDHHGQGGFHNGGEDHHHDFKGK